MDLPLLPYLTYSLTHSLSLPLVCVCVCVCVSTAAQLYAELSQLNLNLPARVCIPMHGSKHQVLRIPTPEAVVLNSKSKVRHPALVSTIVLAVHCSSNTVCASRYYYTYIHVYMYIIYVHVYTCTCLYSS